MSETIRLNNGHLSKQDQQRYWNDGFLHPIAVMPPSDAAALRKALETIEKEWQTRDLPLPLNTYKRVNAHCVLPLAHQIAVDPRILDVVEGVLGPDILIYGVEFFIKEAQTRHRVTMHQDLTYWGLGEIDGLVTAWLALSPASSASGCMDFVRSSHKRPILPHEDSEDPENLLSRGQEVQVDVPEADRIPIELQPGEMSLHHGLTIHGSGPNATQDRRIGAVIRYCTPDIAQKVADKDYVVLARGADRKGNFVHFMPPGSPFSPASLALYDEIRRYQAQAMMVGAKADTKGMYS